MAAPGEATTPRYRFQSRVVEMPVVVRDAASMAATYVVDAAAARALLPGPELDVVEVFPGQALFSIACIDYVDNDLGDYNEVCLALFVRERGRARTLLRGSVTGKRRWDGPYRCRVVPVNSGAPNACDGGSDCDQPDAGAVGGHSIRYRRGYAG